MADLIAKRKLGNTGIELTAIGLGTWGLCGQSYGPVLVEQRQRTLARAIEKGIRTFDMAPWWGADGASEGEVRAAVAARRNEMVFISRAGVLAGDARVEANFEPPALRAQCEASLKRLATDRLDVWLLHEPRVADLRREEVREMLQQLRKAGKVRAWGVATGQADVARVALETDAQVLCLPFDLERPLLMWDLLPEATARGVGLIARSVLLHGLLAGRFSPKQRFGPGDHRAQRWHAEALAERVSRTTELRYLVHGPVLSLAAAAQRFVLAHEAVSCALLGPRTPGQVEAAVNALGGGEELMPAADLERLRREMHG